MWKHELGQNYSEIFLKSYAHRVTYNLVFRIYKLQLNNHNILCNFEYSPSCPFEIDRINPIFKRERNELERWLRAVGSNTLSYFSIYVFTVTIVVTYFEKWGFWEKKVAEAQFEPLFLGNGLLCGFMISVLWHGEFMFCLSHIKYDLKTNLVLVLCKQSFLNLCTYVCFLF